MIAVVTLAGSTGADTITRRISVATDDTENRLSGGNPQVDFTSSDIELGDDGGSRPNTVGLRFTNITVPVGATITEAYIQFEADPADVGTDAGDPASFVVHGEANVDPVTYIDDVTDIPGRTLTTATVNWTNIPLWGAADGRGVNQRTANLATIAQEIIDLPGWASGNAMAFQVAANAGVERTALAFEGSAPAPGDQAADLVITYTSSSPSSVEGWTVYE